ncbi:MAG: hypothetical protein ACRDTT_07240 [Pseudonocardiaceae bacterium]
MANGTPPPSVAGATTATFDEIEANFATALDLARDVLDAGRVIQTDREAGQVTIGRHPEVPCHPRTNEKVPRALCALG